VIRLILTNNQRGIIGPGTIGMMNDGPDRKWLPEHLFSPNAMEKTEATGNIDHFVSERPRRTIMPEAIPVPFTLLHTSPSTILFRNRRRLTTSALTQHRYASGCSGCGC
jgi:hypothetical protein